MTERTDQHFEVIERPAYAPFRITNIIWNEHMDADGQMEDVLEHWHPEVEIVYTYVGHAVHYIDGRAHVAHPGGTIVVNSGSIHKVLSDREAYGDHDAVVATVLHLTKEFLLERIPNLEDKYFLAEVPEDNAAVEKIMRELTGFAEEPEGPYDYLHILSLIHELLYQLSARLVPRERALPVKSRKNLERLRGVMEYVDTHYAEPISQAEVAETFHFTREYFARFFRKNTGMTFMEYLTRVRLGKAKEQLLYSDATVLNIALDNGFSDSRGLINAFKKQYGTTPLQFRKSFS